MRRAHDTPVLLALGVGLALSVGVEPARSAGGQSDACRHFDSAVSLPTTFREDSSASAPAKMGPRDVKETIVWYVDNSCVCMTRASTLPWLDFPGTPDSANFTCAALGEYPASKMKLRSN